MTQGAFIIIRGAFRNRCRVCGKLLGEGKFAFLVETYGRNYLVGRNPPIRCCGEEIDEIVVFNDLEEAKAEGVKIKQRVENGSRRVMLIALYSASDVN